MSEENQALQHQLAHRSIRQFTQTPLSKGTIASLELVAQRTATSHYLQAFSLIAIKDRAKRAAIATVCQQDDVNQNGALWVFVADQHRAALIAEEAGVSTAKLGRADKFFQAVSDTVLAAQNMANAAEALGLGTVFLGSIQNDAQRLIELLQLPPLTFPVLGLLVGHPAEHPQTKPRLPKETVVFTNQYGLKPPVTQTLTAYDQTVRTYYQTRDTNRRPETFTGLVARTADQVQAKRGDLFVTLQHQGFFPEAGRA